MPECELHTSVQQSVYLSYTLGTRVYGARTAFGELPDKGWKLRSIDSLLKRMRKTGTIARLPARQHSVNRVQRVAMEDIVLSQEDKPKRHRSAR